MEEQWLWSVFDARRNAKDEFRGAGNEASAADAVRDMCLNVWENFSAVRK